jgi:hypothetical protein
VIEAVDLWSDWRELYGCVIKLTDDQHDNGENAAFDEVISPRTHEQQHDEEYPNVSQNEHNKEF